MKYQYACEHCSIKKQKKYPAKEGYEIIGYNDNSKEFLFVIDAAISKMPDAKNVACPNCGKKKCYRSHTDCGLFVYVRGQSIVTDTAGAKRDMNSFTLKHKDPYSHMRQSGEKDDMIDKLRHAGMDMGKLRSASCATNSDLKKKLCNDEDFALFNGLEDDCKLVLMILFHVDLNEISYAKLLEAIPEANGRYCKITSDMHDNTGLDMALSKLLHKHKLVVQKKNDDFAFMPGTYRMIEDYISILQM